jgi:simple sugar transport system permease protein
MIVALAIGTAAGIANALITLRFNIPSFIATLGAMLLYHGASSLRFKPSEPFASLFAGSTSRPRRCRCARPSIFSAMCAT